MRWATAILAALIVIPLLSFFAQSYGTDARAVAPVAIGLILLTGIVILTWLRAPAYNPLYVYLMLAVAACIACLLVRLLMFIPPEVVVSGTIILAAVTAFITWRGRTASTASATSRDFAWDAVTTCEHRETGVPNVARQLTTTAPDASASPPKSARWRSIGATIEEPTRQRPCPQFLPRNLLEERMMRRDEQRRSCTKPSDPRLHASCH